MGRGRAPCCEKVGLNKGSWTPEEDLRLIAYIQKYGHGNWRALPRLAGLLRCGKSCRLRWINYLRPDIKRGNFTKEEEETIIKLHKWLGNKWSKIASYLPGRTDNEIKNMWNTHLKKRLASEERKSMVIDKPEDSQSSSSSSTTYHSCSGESKSDEEKKDNNNLSLDLTDFSIEMVEMWGMTQDAIEENSSLKLSPCSSSSELLKMNDDSTDREEIEPEFLDMIRGGGDHGLLGPGVGNSSVGLLQEEEQEGEGKNSEWLVYLEKELGLCGASEDRSLAIRDAADEQIDQWITEMEEDPVSSYFQREFNSPCLLDPVDLRVS